MIPERRSYPAPDCCAYYSNQRRIAQSDRRRRHKDFCGCYRFCTARCRTHCGGQSQDAHSRLRCLSSQDNRTCSGTPSTKVYRCVGRLLLYFGVSYYSWVSFNTCLTRSRNWTRYPISERDFRRSYASVCANGVSVHPNDVRFLPLLFVVLAISVRVAPEHIAGDARSRRLTSLRYYWSCMSILSSSATIQPRRL